jgi:hypothetical protein
MDLRLGVSWIGLQCSANSSAFSDLTSRLRIVASLALMKFLLCRLFASLLAVTGLFSCTSQMRRPQAEGARFEAEAKRSSGDSVAARPGLATGWGNERASTTAAKSFVRASSRPAGTDTIYYNNSKGIKAMTGDAERVKGMQTAAGELVEWGVKGAVGFLPTYKEGRRRLISGGSGGSYTITVRNRSKSALEIVASVDGLDVMDGKTATFAKRGYLVAAGATLDIEGFRTSSDTVAAFKFSSVSNSYANMRHGDTRNVGVIGIAVFTQKGVNPWTWMPEEISRRGQARAFAEAP